MKVTGINPNHFLSQKNGLPFCDEKADFQCFYCFMKWKEFNRIDNERWDKYFSDRQITLKKNYQRSLSLPKVANAYKSSYFVVSTGLRKDD